MTPHKTKAFYRKRLPHWEVERGRYFVTIRQRGSLPQEAIRHLQQLQHDASKPQFSGSAPRRMAHELEKWLDQGHGCCDLTRSPVARMIAEAIDYRVQTGVWEVIEYVIMPNHLHLFCALMQDNLFATLMDFKRWTGEHANKILDRGGSFWQREWFDHWSRSPSQDERIAQYIRNNPIKAGLVDCHLDWPHGSWSTPAPER